MRIPRLGSIRFSPPAFLKNRAPQKPRRQSRPSTRREFYSVSVKPGPRACGEAKRLSGERFLADGAPFLPLPRCDRSTCTCKYQHYADRRGGPRRDEEIGIGSRNVLRTRERRQNDDRREAREQVSAEAADYFGYANGTPVLSQRNGSPKSVKP